MDFKPLPVKGAPERRHLRDEHNSLQGPTNDNQNIGLRAFEYANQKVLKNIIKKA